MKNGQVNYRSVYDREDIQQLCAEMMNGTTELEKDLERLYCLGFENMPQVEGAEEVFARRVIVIYDETVAQLEESWEDHEHWQTKMLDWCLEKDAMPLMAQGLLTMAVEQHAVSSKMIQEDTLCQVLKIKGAKADAICERIIKKCLETPMEDLFFSWQQYPLLDKVQRKRAACVLTMLQYIDCKVYPMPDTPVDLSLDSLCVMSSAATEIATRATPEKKAEEVASISLVQSAALVACSMCVPYMWVNQLSILYHCMHGLRQIIDQTLMQLYRLVKDLESQQGVHIQFETLHNYDFQRDWKSIFQVLTHDGVRMKEPVRIADNEQKDTIRHKQKE